MNNKPITIIALIILGLCLLGKFSMKGNKNAGMCCNIILFIAIVLLAINQLLNEEKFEQLEYVPVDQEPCKEDSECTGESWRGKNILCLNAYPYGPKYCVKRENASDGIAGKYIKWWDYSDPRLNDPANNYTYKCSSGGTFQTYDAEKLSSDQKSIALQNWPGKPASWYACVQGCTGTCDKQGTDFDSLFSTYKKLKGGDNCIYDDQCRSGTCTGSSPFFSQIGKCYGAEYPTGHNCVYDTDCESGACGFNTSISSGDELVCCSGKYFKAGRDWCAKDIDAGGKCTYDLECKSDACGFNTSISGGNELVCCSGKNGIHDGRDWCENDIDVNGECTYNLECKNNACGLNSDYSKYICCPSGKTHVGTHPKAVIGQDICGA